MAQRRRRKKKRIKRRKMMVARASLAQVHVYIDARDIFITSTLTTNSNPKHDGNPDLVHNEVYMEKSSPRESKFFSRSLILKFKMFFLI